MKLPHFLQLDLMDELGQPKQEQLDKKCRIRLPKTMAASMEKWQMDGLQTLGNGVPKEQ